MRPSVSTTEDPTIEAPSDPERGRTAFRTSRGRLAVDRIARWLVTAGGMATIASILGILLFIVLEILPLFGSPELVTSAAFESDRGETLAVLVDEHRTYAALFETSGEVVIVALDDGRVTTRLAAPAGVPRPWVRVDRIPNEERLVVRSASGEISTLHMRWDVRFDGSQRVVSPRLSSGTSFEFFDRPESGVSIERTAVAFADDDAAVGVAVTSDGALVLARQSVEENFLTGEQTVTWERSTAAAPATLTALLVDRHHENVFAAADDGRLVRWPIEDGELSTPEILDSDAPVTAMTFLLGDRSLVTGDRDGTVAVWFPVRQTDGTERLTRIRATDPTGVPVVALAPSPRDKGVLAIDADGGMRLYYSTSDRLLWSGESPVGATERLAYAPKADAVILVGDDRVVQVAIDNPHPEVGWRAFFGKVWYEGYAEPDYVWQSTGGTDEFEPKLSLTPLIVGTMKGTFYSLILAIPLAVLGAMYTSQFMHPALKRTVKPTVELMAALPSVVLGFLAGLWLAPRVEHILPSLAAMCLIVPVFVLAAGYGWRSIPRRYREPFPDGFESILQIGVVAAAVSVSIALNTWIESTVFGGDVQQWLLDATGLRYDQRNALVVGLAMGFAVIPIIFSIAEDAFSNVPRNLVSGSLALGANRWQTVTRIVLPTASPGIFSAIMIGFGRAIGETMIVLMATGNTPLMDWNPFNGFRTLSANVAVEIPEAPHGGTLYRTLFLAALLLFAFTFIVNTGAELVRQRLRKRYAQL